MGFLDKAKAAANDLAAKADTALASSGMGGGPGGSPDKSLRDLGVLAYLEATGRPADPAERERLLGALKEAEARGPLNLTLQTAAPAPGSVPPPPGSAVPPPPPASSPTPQAPVPPSAPPPPPPSWASDDAEKGS